MNDTSSREIETSPARGQEFRTELEQYARTQGIDVFGVANLCGLGIPHHHSIDRLLDRFPRAVSIGVRLPKAVLDDIEDAPTILYAHAYKTANWVLDQTGLRIAGRIQSYGYGAAPIAASQTVDWERQLGHLSHRAVAQLAGIGSQGYSGLTIHPLYGAQVRYATILTDIPLRTDTPAEPVCRWCTTCGACITACPAQAIRPDHFDRDACIAQLTRFSKIQGVGKHICGICVKVCQGHIHRENRDTPP